MTYGDNAISVADTKSGAPEVIPVKNLANLIDDATFTTEVTGNPGIWYGWHGAVSGGITVIESTQNGQSYNVAVNLARLIPSVDFLPPRTRSTINVLETYGKITQPAIPQTIPPTLASVTKTNIFHADAEHDKYFDATKLYGLVGVSSQTLQFLSSLCDLSTSTGLPQRIPSFERLTATSPTGLINGSSDSPNSEYRVATSSTGTRAWASASLNTLTIRERMVSANSSSRK